MTIVKFITDDFHQGATSSTNDLKSNLSVSQSLNIERSSIIYCMVANIARTSPLRAIYVLFVLVEGGGISPETPVSTNK